MKLKSCVAGLVAVGMIVAVAAPAVAAPPKYIMPEASRTLEGGRAGQVLVAQSELKSNINPSTISVAAGGGLLVALIDAKIESDRAKRAEAAIVPLRDALTGYDVDALAVGATKTIIAQTPWIAAGDPAFGRDTSVLGKSGVLDAASGGQVAFFEYVYDMAPDFSSVRVSLTIQVANKAGLAGKKPETRLHAKQLVYSQTVTSVVSLPTPSKEMEENVTRWSADNGKLARTALADAFADVAVLAPRALPLTEADAKAMNGKDKKMAFNGGFSGRTQEEGEQGALLFNGGFVRIKTIAE